MWLSGRWLPDEADRMIVPGQDAMPLDKRLAARRDARLFRLAMVQLAAGESDWREMQLEIALSPEPRWLNGPALKELAAKTRV